jgi:hypothetical protein
MDGKSNMRLEVERPIEKPAFPLPLSFCPSKRAEGPTKRRLPERAHFYRKDTSGSGTPVYGFYIANETGERENPGSDH